MMMNYHTNDDTIVIHNTQTCLEKRDAWQKATTQKRKQKLWDAKIHWQLSDNAQALDDGAKRSEELETTND
jgi:hypothetical protein